MMLRGYRREDAGLLTGHWVPGELLGVACQERPALAEPVSVAPPTDATAELCVVADLGFVRFSELDWIHRRGRLEIGLRPETADQISLLLKSALAHGFRVLNLRRVHGWVTPAAHPPADLLAEAGFRCEATVPDAIWWAGRPVDRQVWGVIRDE